MVDQLGSIRGKKEFKAKKILYLPLLTLKKLFPRNHWNSLSYLLIFQRHFLRILYTIFTFFTLSHLLAPLSPLHLAFVIASIAFTSLMIDVLCFLLIYLKPFPFLRTCSPFVSFFLLLFFPITLLFLLVQKKILQSKHLHTMPSVKPTLKEKILELLHDSRLESSLAPVEQHLILSVASFHNRIAREIMVPRIDIFALGSHQTLRDVMRELAREGFSRIPIYEGTIDHIVGLLLYKDVMKLYHQSKTAKDPSLLLATPLSSLVKPVLYTPETKKISSLLQEFRQKQTHLAIVVDEYGGTEGLVTTEDILEELVGEIADEHDDIKEKKSYTPLVAGNGWIIDAKMTILDIEKELGLQLPTSPEYDTIGGLIFHRAGMIPSKGWRLHGENFDMEVIASSERAIEKIQLKKSTHGDSS